MSTPRVSLSIKIPEPPKGSALSEWLAEHLMGWTKATPSIYICNARENYDWVDKEGKRHGLGGPPTWTSSALSTWTRLLHVLYERNWITEIHTRGQGLVYVEARKPVPSMGSEGLVRCSVVGDDVALAVCEVAYQTVWYDNHFNTQESP